MYCFIYLFCLLSYGLGIQTETSILPTANKYIDIRKGIMRIVGHEKCKITSGTMNKEIDVPLIDGTRDITLNNYFFGLVNYECGNEKGFIISKPSCFDCGIYCSSNDLIVGCQNRYLRLTFGISTGILLTILITFCLHNQISKFFEYIYHKLVIFIQTKRDKSSNKKANEFNKMTNIECTPMYKENLPHLPKYKEKMDKVKFVPLLENVATKEKENDHNTLNESPGPSNEKKLPYSNADLDKINEEIDKIALKIIADNAGKGKKSKKQSNITAKGFLTGLLLASSAKPTYSCDMTYYVNTAGHICDYNSCHDINIFNFPLSYGGEICFQSGKETTHFKILKSFTKHRYFLEYLACDYNIDTQKYWECEGVGSCDKHNCRAGKSHKSFTNNTSINRDNCVTTSSPCDTYCFYGTNCVYTRVTLSKGSDCYKVYKSASSIWEIDIQVTVNEISTVTTLNVNNPSIDMKFSSIKGKKMPLHVTNYQSEVISAPLNLAMIENYLVGVTASQLNFPIKGLIGEFQLSTNNAHITADPDIAKCQIDNCEVSCESYEPSIKRLRNMADNNKLFKFDTYKSTNNGDTIDLIIKSKPTITLTVGNVDFKNLLVLDSKCKLRIAMTFGCKACGIKPYIVVVPYDIKTEGILDFYSNCTTSLKYLSCNYEPYILELDEDYHKCVFEIPRLNMTLDALIDYDYMGDVSPINMVITKESFTSIAKSIVINSDFINSLGSTLTACALISTLTTISIKVYQIYMTTKVKREVEHIV